MILRKKTALPRRQEVEVKNADPKVGLTAQEAENAGESIGDLVGEQLVQAAANAQQALYQWNKSNSEKSYFSFNYFFTGFEPTSA